MSRRKAKRICLISNAPISMNPRLVKEASALSAAGFEVVITYGRHAARFGHDDENVVKGKPWKVCPVLAEKETVIGRLVQWLLRVRRRIFGAFYSLFPCRPFLEWSFSLYFFEQLAIALTSGADLFIAHNPQSLPIAAWAARMTRRKYAFDAEDYHLGEFDPSEFNTAAYKKLQRIEKYFLAGCAYVSAASPGIADAIRQMYGIRTPAVILNVFPLSLREKPAPAPPDRLPKDTVISFYWFSQIINFDRGLDDVLKAASGINEPFELHLRGDLDRHSRAALNKRIKELNLSGRINIHSVVANESLIPLTMQHDVGLCLEIPKTINRDICITNKMFVYWLCGLAVIASRTQGNEWAKKSAPGTVLLYESGNAKELRRLMLQCIKAPESVRRMKENAYEWAVNRWNWETEAHRVVELVNSALGNGTHE